MKKRELAEVVSNDPFIPFRLQLAGVKVIDVPGPNTAHTLSTSLLVLRNPRLGTTDAEGYDVLAYENIERIERLQIGKRPGAKKRPA